MFDRTVICPLRLKKTHIYVLDIHPQKDRRSDISSKFISITLSYSLCSIPVSLGGNIGTQHDHSQMGIIPQTPPFFPPWVHNYIIAGVTSVFFWSCDSVVGDSLEFNQANRGSLRV